MNEENGLHGGKTYAQDHEAELAKHIGAMETDGGAGHPLGINIKGKRELEALLAPVAKVLQATGAGLLNMAEQTGADIGPMEPAGVPTFSPIQDSRTYFHYHHTAADTLDKIVPRELAENAAVNAVLAYALANSEQPLPR
jgi:Zn-dependent M28 family amino/carboxypeptidase